MHNELIYTRITLTKTDITGENTVPGAVIEVRNSDGEVIYRATTDEKGLIPDIPVIPGTYTFHEVLAPEGYALNETVMTFTVDENGNVTGDTIIRDDYTRVSLLKRDDGNQFLAGVEFSLLKEDGTVLMTAVTNENGLVTFERIPYGNYTIVESKPLPGYLINDTQIPVVIDGHFVNPTEPLATFINRRMRFEALKVDTSGRFIPGVEFSLINAKTNQVMESVTSNERGEFVFTKLDYGDWIIRETKVPDGFNQMDDLPLHVDHSWTQPEPFTFTNIPNHYTFMKVDQDGKPLAGVQFSLEDESENVLRDLVSGEDGIVHVADLAPGVYVIRETQALDGFVRTEETIRVVIDENYIVPEEMVQVINYPGIQTGFELTMTPMMWVGAALMVTAAVLLVMYSAKNRKKKYRRKGR